VNLALVLPDKEGKPYTVRYDAVNVMLLNEFLKSCLEVVQIHGGAGFLAELEREMRDSMGSTLYSGTSKIQRNIIARGLRL
jgi:alkylation response protein AidB-like acyl-CoA dehydrogenase